MEYINQGAHSNLVASAVKGDSNVASISPPIINSWKRCLEDYRLDPDRQPEPIIVNRDDLQERQEKSCRLLEITRAEMTSLYQQVAGSGYSIMLTDTDGVVLNYVGDPLFTSTAARTGLQTGAVWSEEAQGTNGMGTCLIEKRPLVIHQNEHFLSKNTPLTCAAAPIFDSNGELMAVLDASSKSQLAQDHTMVLVNMSAQLIENRLFLCHMQGNYILRFHSRSEFVGTLGEGIIAFDPAGTLLAANRSALFQLDMESVEQIIGQNLTEIFHLRPDAALDQAHGQTNQVMPLRETRQGRRFYASFQPPMAELNQPRSSVSVSRRPLDASKNESALDDLEFGDARMRRNIERAKKLLEKDIPFIVLGETGTGKDMFTKALHRSSSRRDKPLVAVNCASLPESLIESELFGYKPGAFTGASKDGSRGKIAQADGGTLFLDEIGDMPMHLQARLLRVLEEREVTPLGSETPIKVDIRLISATHQDLKQQVDDGHFREDLYYRLHGIALTMPPLRDREDRKALIEHLMVLEAGGDDVDIEEEALRCLDNYEWPGNLRQLRNMLRTLVNLCDDGLVRLDDLPEEVFSSDGEETPQKARPSNPLDIAERDTILRELEAAHWNVTRVASKLNLSRNTLYRKMKRFNIKPPR